VSRIVWAGAHAHGQTALVSDVTSIVRTPSASDALAFPFVWHLPPDDNVAVPEIRLDETDSENVATAPERSAVASPAAWFCVCVKVAVAASLVAETTSRAVHVPFQVPARLGPLYVGTSGAEGDTGVDPPQAIAAAHAVSITRRASTVRRAVIA
jgi:hypothetical protein